MCTKESKQYQEIDIAKTVKDIANLTNPYAKVIVDRSTEITDDFVKRIITQSVFSWEGRKPRPALDDNFVFQGTDLDLLSFMVPMMVRGAVIEIPKYRNRRKAVKKECERRVGTSRFGNVTGLISNKDISSFSVRIFDRSVVVMDPDTQKESVGAHRNFMLVDCDGYWHDGWDKIVWNPDSKENAFLNEHNLWTGNSVCFTHYVHPNRRQSIFGAPYLLLKMLTSRITDEAKYYRKEVKRLEGLGFCLPDGEKAPYSKPCFEGESKKIKVETMEVALDFPSFTGEYKKVKDGNEGLLMAYRRQKHLTYTLKPLVQFVVRADEVAYFKYGHKSAYVASWVNGACWVSGYRLPRGRVDWNRIVFSPTLALRYRIKEVTQNVSEG